MHNAVQVLRYVNLVAYVALGAVTFGYWLRRRDRPARWAAVAFGSLGLLELLALIPANHGNLLEQVNVRVVIALLVLFPYLLFRFTNAFRVPNPRLANGLLLLSAILVVWTFALPRIPKPGEHRSAEFEAWITVFFVHWTVLSIVSAWSLWRAGRAQPTVARRRMQFLALRSGAHHARAAAGAAVVEAGVVARRSARQTLALVSVVAFFLAFAPPQVLRILWRTPEQARMQQAIASLLTFAETQEEVAARVLEPAAAIVGARAIAIGNAEGKYVASWNVPDAAWPSLERGATPAVWRTRGCRGRGRRREQDDRLDVSVRALLRRGGARGCSRRSARSSGLALDRVRLFQAEHEARVALERANEVKTNFIALAAHELRTPMTTIHGFVTTLHHLGDRLDEEQRVSVRDALIQQTAAAWRRSSSSCSISPASTQRRSTSRPSESTSAPRSRTSSAPRRPIRTRSRSTCRRTRSRSSIAMRSTGS